nr:uncharacterized protein LOC109150431 [Ipomoea trifida]
MVSGGEVDKLANGRGIRWSKWEDLCKRKTAGGMGFRHIRDLLSTQIHWCPGSLKSNISEIPIFSMLLLGVLWKVKRLSRRIADRSEGWKWIWESRNQKVWNRFSPSTATVVRGARSYLEAWTCVQNSMCKPTTQPHRSRWMKPPQGCFKLNVDI